ncbi:MAG: hypothetical protein QM487_04265, partial [Candidatus Marithrix sp.]
MKKIIIYIILTFYTNCFAYTYNLTEGWNLLGTTESLQLSTFDNSCAEIIWSYNGEWKQYSPSDTNNTITQLSAGIGFWTNTNTTCQIDTNNTNPSQGEKLYRNAISNNSSFACVNCHALTEPAENGFRRAGHLLGDATKRTRYKNDKTS